MKGNLFRFLLFSFSYSILYFSIFYYCLVKKETAFKMSIIVHYITPTMTNNDDFFSETLPFHESFILLNSIENNEENTTQQTQQDDFSTSHSLMELSDDIKGIEGENNQHDVLLITPPTFICHESAQDSIAVTRSTPIETPEYVTDIDAAVMDESENDGSETEISSTIISDHFVRRSTRDPTLSLLERNDIRILVPFFTIYFHYISTTIFICCIAVVKG